MRDSSEKPDPVNAGETAQHLGGIYASKRLCSPCRSLIEGSAEKKIMLYPTLTALSLSTRDCHLCLHIWETISARWQFDNYEGFFSRGVHRSTLIDSTPIYARRSIKGLGMGWRKTATASYLCSFEFYGDVEDREQDKQFDAADMSPSVLRAVTFKGTYVMTSIL